MESFFHFAVIGAGASGLTAAAEAAKRGVSVIVIDNLDPPAAKVLISGGGKCNFTNRNASSEHYLSANPHFCKSALAKLPPQDVISSFERGGIRWEEREDGKIFAFSASDICKFLIGRAKEAGSVFHFGKAAYDVERDENGFLVSCKGGNIRCRCLLVATGSPACPAAGGNDFGIKLAEKFGLGVIPSAPALVPFRFAETAPVDFSDLSGIALPVCIKTAGKRVKGRLLFTHKGLSGPAVLTASLYWNAGEKIVIDFLPDDSPADFLKKLKARKDKRKTASALSELMPQRLAAHFAALLPEDKREKPLTELPDKLFSVLEDGLKRCAFIPSGTDGYAKAEVAKGGIDTREIDSATMECRRIPGLYFSGEVLDVTGELGGYNLHWAWASGTAAGRAAART